MNSAGARYKFYFTKVGLIQRHFPESVSETSGLLSDEAFDFRIVTQ